ncbi:hypothetical protein WDU99_12965 [Microbacterium sp. Mu-80]|uniref:Uncharacterized protein n=1 Tax=Microbacterium bandirmense TaxID=3122050 RepID=A0ABU8LD15_9MICO
MAAERVDGHRPAQIGSGQAAPALGMTRRHLRIAAFAAVQVFPILALAPLMPQVAAWSPPAYAALAGAQTLFIFAARRMVGLRWSATVAAAMVAVLVGPFSAVGWLIAVPLMIAGAAFDGMMWMLERSRLPVVLLHVLIGGVVGSALFVVSLPVMSAEHLQPGLLLATWLSRVVTSVCGSWLSARLVAALHRAGVR